MKKNYIGILSLGCMALIIIGMICSIIMFLLFGYIPGKKGQCAYSGPFSSDNKCKKDDGGEDVTPTPTSNPTPTPEDTTEPTVKPTTTTKPSTTPSPTQTPPSGYNNYTGDTFSLQYPTSWFVEEDTQEVIISNQELDLNEDMPKDIDAVIVIVDTTPIVVTESTCSAITTSVTNSVSSSTGYQLINNGVTAVNGQPACVVTYNITEEGYNLTQTVYALGNTSNTYMVATTSQVSSTNKSVIDQIVSTFSML